MMRSSQEGYIVSEVSGECRMRELATGCRNDEAFWGNDHRLMPY